MGTAGSSSAQEALARRAWETLASVPLTRMRGPFEENTGGAAAGIPALADLQEHVLAALPQVLPRLTPDHRTCLASDVQSALQQGPRDDPGRAARRERLLANHLAFADELAALSRGLTGFAYGAVAQEALILRDQGGWLLQILRTDYLTVPADQRDDAAAFIVAAHLTALEDEDFDDALGDMWVRRGELALPPRDELVAVARRHLASCTRLVRTAVGRKNLDPRALDAVLSSPAAALASGAL